jgi:hypothetical protein
VGQILWSVARKPITLTLGEPKIQSKFPNRVVYAFGNISSEILSGSVGVFFSEVLK